METTLQNGWVSPSIGECLELNPKIDKSEIPDDKVIHFVPMPAVEALSNKINTSEIRKFGEVKKGYTPFTSNDVLFAKITPCMENGKMVVVPELQHGLAFGSTEFHVIRSNGNILPQWVFYFVSSHAFRAEAEHNMTGAVGQRRVPIDFIAKHEFPLPPLNEQKRIVEKIEALFSEIDAGVASLQQARTQLGVYRQALLKKAFTGELTAQWRQANPDQIEPESWKDVSVLDVLTDKPRNGKSVKSREGGFRVLRLTALQNGNINLSEFKEGDWDENQASAYVVRQGDFLVSRGNGSIRLVGRGGIVKENAEIAFPDTMIRLPLDLKKVDPGFFGFVWNSEHMRQQIERSARTTAGIYKINQSLLCDYRLPICSLPEQKEIVRLLEAQFEAIEQNEREIDAALARAEALRQSILKKAFSGQLVEQDPNDEPASVLLEKI